MKTKGYYQPESYQKRLVYFAYDENNSTENKYKKVEFLGYRPHPGELLIKDNGVIKVIHRKLLKKKKNGI